MEYQEHPRTPRSSAGAPQEPPGVPQEHPRTSRSSPGDPQEHLGTHQEYQGGPRSTQEHPNLFKPNGSNFFKASKMKPKC